MSDDIRDARLASELEEMTRLREESSLIDFKPNDDQLPDQYYVKFGCQGLAKKKKADSREVIGSTHHMVHIYLPADYPRVPPIIRFKTPIFHPNVRAMIDDDEAVQHLAEQVGGLEKLEQLYHENPMVREMFDAHICLDVLKLNWTPAYTLYDICLELGAMIQYQRYNVDDPLNPEAAEWARWAREQPNLLPIDARDLRDRLQVASLKSSSRTDIRILKVEKV